MKRTIFGSIIILAFIAIAYFLGSMFPFTEAKIWLIITVSGLAVLFLGYFLHDHKVDSDDGEE